MDMTLADLSAAAPSPAQELGRAASAALTDSMVERLVTAGSTGLEVLDRLNDPETRAAVHRLLDGLTTMHATGSLDTLFELVATLHAARSAATDQMVERLCHFLETMATNLATTEIAELARDTEFSLYEAAQRCGGSDAPKSLWGVLRCLFKPDTVRTLNLLLAFGTCLGERTRGYQMRPEPRPNE